MCTLNSWTLAGCLAWSMAGCSSGPPKPALPDGLHRVPINRVYPVPDVPPAVPVAPDRSVSSDAGEPS
ncbi:type IV secretion system protein VirB7 [Paraburkholderia sacchari]